MNPNPSGNGPNNNAHPKKFRPNKRRNNNNNTAAAAAAAASNSNNAQQNTDEVNEVNEIMESRLNRSVSISEFDRTKQLRITNPSLLASLVE